MGKPRTLANTVSTGGPLEDGAIAVADVTGLQSRIGSEGSLSGRNRIINGDMRIDQRNADAAVTVSGVQSQAFPVDRWIVYVDGGSATGQRVADGPAGFPNSLRFTVTGTSTGPGLVQQRIEGLNAADLAWGTASAQTVTLSFWAKASITGTFGVAVANWSGTRATYAATFTINAANTWEYKTVTIPGSTAGTWATDNTQHAQIRWTLSPTTSPVTAGSWQVGDAIGVTGQTNLMATNGATFQVTGAQFEVGSVATPFERRSYGAELALCQRYFYKTYNTDVAVGTSTSDGMMFLETLASGDINRLKSFNPRLPVPMRVAPTVSAYSQTGTIDRINVYSNSASTLTVSSVSNVGTNTFLNYLQTTTNAVAASTYACHMTASAEL